MREKQNKVTLQAIADAVGLSKYAVSRSLSGKSGVSEETRSLIHATAEKLGYSKAPAKAATQEVAVVFYDQDPVNSELNLQVQAGIQNEAERLNVGIRIRWTHSADLLEDMARNFAGMVLVGPHERTAVAKAAAVGVPIVRLGWTDPLEQIDSVGGSDHEGGQAMAQYLLELGHRTIAYVYGLPIYRGRQERYYGAREIVEQAGDAELHLIQFDETTGFSRALGELTRKGVKPTAFFCAHDGLALTVVSELLGAGYRIPDDVSVVGFGDYSPATQISPPLTTIRVEGKEAGAVSLQLILDRLERPKAQDQPARNVRIVPRIIVRRSAGPVRIIE